MVIQSHLVLEILSSFLCFLVFLCLLMLLFLFFHNRFFSFEIIGVRVIKEFFLIVVSMIEKFTRTLWLSPFFYFKNFTLSYFLVWDYFPVLVPNFFHSWSFYSRCFLLGLPNLFLVP